MAADTQLGRYSDNDLVHMAQLGNAAAFSTLWERHAVWIRQYVSGYVSTPEDLDDLVQEVSLRIHRGIPGYRIPSSFTSWAARIARNVGIDSVRRANVRRFTQAPSGEGAASETADLRFEPSAIFGSAYLREELRAALRSLTPDLQQTVVLRYFYGMSTAQVASELACPQGTVKSRLHTALSRLRAQLEERG